MKQKLSPGQKIICLNRKASFNYFFEKQQVLHEELRTLKDSTRKKLRQVIFRILKDLNMISKAKEINPLLPSIDLKEVSKSTRKDVKLFLPGLTI